MKLQNIKTFFANNTPFGYFTKVTGCFPVSQNLKPQARTSNAKSVNDST